MRALRWLITALIAAGFVGVLASLRDPIRIQMGMWDVSLPFGLFFFFLFALICLFILIDRLLQQGAAYARWRRVRKTHTARAVLLKGLGQLATRDVTGAMESDKKVDRLWHGVADDPFRLLFKGRLAESNGDHDAALLHYKELAKQKEARLFALRSQLRVAQITHDQPLLRRLSADVLKLAPDDLTLYDIRIDALRAEKKWGAAHNLLKKLARNHCVSLDTITQMHHDLYLEQSTALLADGKPMQARHYARQAYKNISSAAAIAAELDGYLATENRKAAQKLLTTTWKKQADEALLPYWKKLAPERGQFAFYQATLKANPSSPLTHKLLVESAVQENKGMEARAHLDALRVMKDADLAYAEAASLIAEYLDHDTVSAQGWRDKAHVIRRTKTPLIPAASVKPLRTRLLPPDAFA